VTLSSKIGTLFFLSLSALAVTLGALALGDLERNLEREHLEYMQRILEDFTCDHLIPAYLADPQTVDKEVMEIAHRRSELTHGDLMVFSKSGALLSQGARTLSAAQRAAWRTLVAGLGSNQNSAHSGLAHSDELNSYYTYRRFDPLGWTILFSLKSSEIEEELQSAAIHVVLAWAGAVAGAYIVLMMILRRFLIGPLLELQDMTSRIASGETPAFIPRPSSDHLTELYRSIVFMADEIGRGKAALSNTNALLEEEVKVRTADLKRRNHELRREVHERRAAERKLITVLEEKEILLREVHHRVKNNLLVIYSLLEFEKQFHADREPALLFTEVQNRVETMALIHSGLYHKDDVSRLNLKEYLAELAAHIRESMLPPDTVVVLSVDGEEMEIGLNQAVPCGLMVNELVSNVMKHAFVGRTHGRIDIGIFRNDPQVCRISVADNGIGYGEDDELRHGMGSYLLEALTEQLGATYSCKSQNGTTCAFEFVLEETEE